MRRPYLPCGNASRISSNSAAEPGKKRIWSKNRKSHGTPGSNSAVVTYGTTAEFEPGVPWLLRFFDQIRFFPGSAAELLEIRDAFPHGKYGLRIEQNDFSLSEYHSFLRGIAGEASQFKKRQ